MDTTWYEDPVYIKMSDCEEIQERKPEGSQGEFVYCEGEAYQEIDDKPLTPFIWLPTQSQLQEMVGLVDGVHYHYQDLERHFYEWIKRHDYRWIHYTATSEQLWLAFVMKEKYNKVWSGEEWIN